MIITRWRSCELHERRLRRQHPAQQQEVERVVPERDHGLQDPEDGLVVTEEVVAEGEVLFAGALKKGTTCHDSSL